MRPFTATALFRCWHLILFFAAWSTGTTLCGISFSELTKDSSVDGADVEGDTQRGYSANTADGYRYSLGLRHLVSLPSHNSSYIC